MSNSNVSELFRLRTGLVLVDPYNDFLSERGKVWPRLREVAEAVGVRQHLRELVAGTRGAELPLFIAPHRRWRPGDFDGWRRLARGHRGILDERTFEVGTFGGEWYPDLAPRPGDVVASEHWGMSGFAYTDLDLQLRQHGIEHIVLAGMTAPGCVEGTGRNSLDLGYAVTLVKDATAAFTHELQHAATQLMAPFYANWIATTDEVVAALKTK